MAEEGKKPEEQKIEKAAEEKHDDKKPEESKGDKDGKEAKDQPPPPPPEIVLKVYMHSEGCAHKVRRYLKGFPGVEDVITDCKTSKVVVKGEKADPLKVLERVQLKSHRQVELLSPILKPPPPEIVLKVYMRSEVCAYKVRRYLKGFQGVEDVITDCKTSKVVVKGEKADPLKVLERVQRKSHRQVELLSPIPKPPPPAERTPEEKEKSKPEEKKEEPQTITVVLKVHMHCEACAQRIKRRMQRMKGVESAEPDLKNSQMSVKGVFDPPKLVEYVHKRTWQHAVIVKQEPVKKEEEARAGEEEKIAEGGKKENKEKKEAEADAAKAPEAAPVEETKVAERKRRKGHRQVELPSPIPKPPPPEEKTLIEKKEEPQIITVVLKAHMLCEACALAIKRRIQRMKGVESIEPDLKNSQVSVKGVFDPSELVEYVCKRTGKHAVIVKQEPEKEEEAKAEEEENKEKNEAEADAAKALDAAPVEETKVLELKS